MKFHVEDMSCGHCKASVEAALAALPAAAPVAVDLTTQQITVGSPAPAETLVKALAEIGFPAQVVIGA